MSYAQIGPLNLYYEVHGEGEPLILLHGAYMTADMMAPLTSGLTGRQVIVDLGCGPGAITELILERVRGQQPPPRIIGVDPSSSAIEKARAAISSKLAEFVQGSAEWLSNLVKSAVRTSPGLGNNYSLVGR